MDVAARALCLQGALDPFEPEVAGGRPDARRAERAGRADVGRGGVALELRSGRARDPDADLRGADAPVADRDRPAAVALDLDGDVVTARADDGLLDRLARRLGVVQRYELDSGLGDVRALDLDVAGRVAHLQAGSLGGEPMHVGHPCAGGRASRSAPPRTGSEGTRRGRSWPLPRGGPNRE